MKENDILKNQLEDIKTTLTINKDLLYKYISQAKNQDKNATLFDELKAENGRLTEKISSLFTEKTQLEKKVYDL